MNARAMRVVALLAAGGFMFAASAGAEVTVSVTLSGTVEEIMPILQHLRDLGIGGAAKGGQEALKVEVHSTAPGAPGAPEGAPATAQPLKPPLALNSPALSANPAKAGDVIRLSVGVSDPDKVVDTVAAKIGDQEVDMFDNGAHGDEVAGDGIWTADVQLPGDAQPGEHVVSFEAYGAYGYPVVTTTPEGHTKPLIVETTLRVVQ